MEKESLKQSIISQIEVLGFAAYLGTKKDEENFLEYLPNIDYQDIFRMSALMWACGNNYIEIVKKLIDANANLNLQSDTESTALIFAIHNEHLEAVNLLIKAKADLNIPTENNITPLMMACYIQNINIVKSLIDAKVNLDLQSKDGETTLIRAVRMGNIDIVKLLLQSKANINVLDNQGFEALRWAYYNLQMDPENKNHQKIVNILVPYKLKSRIFESKLFKFFKKKIKI